MMSKISKTLFSSAVNLVNEKHSRSFFDLLLPPTQNGNKGISANGMDEKLCRYAGKTTTNAEKPVSCFIIQAGGGFCDHGRSMGNRVLAAHPMLPNTW
ncbi:hypothetical protein [Desulforamulus profundi]|uniref:hypothetical protein n=1 Tax=Desulforamulus profundi TaxID=1383067 RepID=UPI0015D4F9B5|nr:hypothetical protein [Desulforamulus profundi]